MMGALRRPYGRPSTYVETTDPYPDSLPRLGTDTSSPSHYSCSTDCPTPGSDLEWVHAPTLPVSGNPPESLEGVGISVAFDGEV